MTPVGTPVGFAVAIGNPARWAAARIDADAAQAASSAAGLTLVSQFPYPLSGNSSITSTRALHMNFNAILLRFTSLHGLQYSVTLGSDSHTWSEMGNGRYASSRNSTSSWVNFTSRAPSISSKLARLVLPTIGAVTPGFESSQAKETCAMLTPLRFASSSTLWGCRLR